MALLMWLCISFRLVVVHQDRWPRRQLALALGQQQRRP
jgi:hypothetical protein